MQFFTNCIDYLAHVIKPEPLEVSSHTIDGTCGLQSSSSLSYHRITLFPWPMQCILAVGTEFFTYCSIPQLQTPNRETTHFRGFIRLRTKGVAYATVETFFTIVARTSTIAVHLYCGHGRLNPTNWMPNPPEATWWTRKTHWLLVMVDNRSKMHLRYYSPRFSCRWLGFITSLPIPWRHLVCHTDGSQGSKRDTKSRRCYRQTRPMGPSAVWKEVQRSSSQGN